MGNAGTEARLLTCLRWDRLGDAALAGLSDEDWRSLMAVLRARNGLHFLSRRLEPAPGPKAPSWVVGELRVQAKATAIYMLQTVAHLRRCFSDIDFPVLALKGLDLAHRVYPHPGVRPMSDCDFLVPIERVLEMDAVMLRHGYRRKSRLDTAIIQDNRQHHTFYRPSIGEGLPVEVHWRLSSISCLGRERETAGILARSQPIGHPSLAPVVRVLEREDMLLYLSEHIAHHDFDTSLTQVWDLAEVIRWGGERFDWPTFWRRAEAARLTNAARLCLYQLENTLGVAVPAAMTSTGKQRPPENILKCLPDVLPNLGCFFHDRHSRDEFDVAVALNSNRTVSDWLAWAKRKSATPASVDGPDVPVTEPTVLQRALAGCGFLLTRRRLVWRWLTGGSRVREKARRRQAILAWVADR